LFLFVSALYAKKAQILGLDAANVIPNRFIVVFKPLTETQLSEEHALAKTTFGDRVKHVYKHALQGFAVELLAAEREIEILRRNPNVDYIEADQTVKIAGNTQTCEDAEFGSWGQTRVSQKDVDLDGKFQVTGPGTGVNAYILDTGIYLEHNEFQGRAKFIFKAETSWSNTDGNGHGTHVSSTVGGKIYGIAKDVTLLAVKVLSDGGSGSYAGVIAGIDYVVEHRLQENKPSVANMSLGGGKSVALDQAVENAIKNNILFAIAAGNNNGNACNFSPAAAPDAVTCGATDVGDQGEGNQVDIRSYFSNYGECVDVLAPGTAITGAWIGGPDQIHTISGTSMAAPHVCGLAAVLWGNDHKMTWKVVSNQLLADSSADLIDLQCNNNAICLKTPNLLAYNGCNAKKRTDDSV